MTNSIYNHPHDYDEQYHGYNIDIPFWLSVANKYANRRNSILEMTCGTGRVTFELVKAGFSVLGVDLSNEMLEVARQKAALLDNGQKLNIKLVQGNMINYTDIGNRDLIIVPFTAFQHLMETKDQLASLINMRDQLSPEGRLLVDIQNPDPLWLAEGLKRFKNPIEGKRVQLADGRLLVRRQITEYSRADQILHWIFYIDIYDEDGNLDHSYTEDAYVSAIFPREWRLLIKAAGLEIEHEYGDYSFGEFIDNSPRMLFVCRKA